MTKDEALEIITIEKLKFYSINPENTNLADHVVLQEVDNEWIVFSNDERGCRYGAVRTFKNEEEAFKNFIKRVRATNFSINDLENRIS